MMHTFGTDINGGLVFERPTTADGAHDTAAPARPPAGTIILARNANDSTSLVPPSFTTAAGGRWTYTVDSDATTLQIQVSEDNGVTWSGPLTSAESVAAALASGGNAASAVATATAAQITANDALSLSQSSGARSINGVTPDANGAVTLVPSNIGALPATGPLAAANVTGLAAVATSGNFTDLSNRPPIAIPLSQKGVASGVAALNPAGQVIDASGVVVNGSDGVIEEVASSQLTASGYGFSLTRTDLGHRFLRFAANGDMIASLPLSNGGRTIGKSSDGGATWTALGVPSTTDAPKSLWFSSAGTWFAHTAGQLYRSTDSGMTWASVVSCGTLLDQGFADAGSGTLWLAEYMGDARVFRSTDDGVTWTVVYNFPDSDNGDANPVIRHIHGIASFTTGIWCFTGDVNTEAGLWKWDTASSTFIRQSPLGPSLDANQEWRAVGVAERNGYFYWVQDGASSASRFGPGIFKANPTDLAGTITRLATLPTGGWYIKKLPTGELVVGSIAEPGGGGKESDSATRLWVIDNADRVHEVLAFAYADSPNTDFPGVRNLDVAPNGTVAMQVNNTSPSGSQYMTVTGTVRAGGETLAVSRTTVPRAYADTARAWVAQTPLVTAGPTYAGSSYADIPDMAVKVTSGAARPLLVNLNLDARCSIAGQYITYRLILMSDITGGVVQIGDYRSYGAQTYGTMSMLGLITPAAPGSYTVKAQWLTGGGATVESRGFLRTLTVVEV